MQDAILHPDRYFSGEAWVLGDQAPPSLDRSNLTQQLAGRYLGDYQSEWRTFLRAAQVVKYRNLSDAAAKLQKLSNPVLRCWRSSTPSHTTLRSRIRTSRRNSSLRRRSSRSDSADKLVGRETPLHQRPSRLTRRRFTGRAGYHCGHQSSGGNSPSSRRPLPLIGRPARRLRPLIWILRRTWTKSCWRCCRLPSIRSMKSARSEDRPGKGGRQGFCAAFRSVTEKFPFSPNAAVEASPAEVAAFLQPGTGSCYGSFTIPIEDAATPAGNTYAPVAGSPIQLNPAFTAFLQPGGGFVCGTLSRRLRAPGLTFTAHILPSKGYSEVSLCSWMRSASRAPTSRNSSHGLRKPPSRRN